jgi:hypothetical protein
MNGNGDPQTEPPFLKTLPWVLYTPAEKEVSMTKTQIAPYTVLPGEDALRVDAGHFGQFNDGFEWAFPSKSGATLSVIRHKGSYGWPMLYEVVVFRDDLYPGGAANAEAKPVGWQTLENVMEAREQFWAQHGRP